MTHHQQMLATNTIVDGLAEHTIVLQQCRARSLSWRMLRIYDAGLSDEQRALAKGLEHVWAPDMNSRLKRTLLTFQWWRKATLEEARLINRFFSGCRERWHSNEPALLAA
jgi:hypothetical protein